MVERSARAAALSMATAACLVLGGLAPAEAQDVGPPDRGLDRDPRGDLDQRTRTRTRDRRGLIDRRDIGIDNRDLDQRPDRAQEYEWGPRERGTRFGRTRYGEGGLGQDRMNSDDRVGGRYVIQADDDPDEVLFKKLGNLGMDLDGLQFDFRDGVLTVEGLVNAPGDEDLILQQAYLLEDVEEVENLLLMRSPFRSDRRIQMAAEAAIEADPALNLRNLDLEVRDQTAYVSGTVPTPIDAELVVSTLRGVRGVEQVVPRLRAARGISEVSDLTLEEYLWRRVLSTPRLAPGDLENVRLQVDDRLVRVAGTVDDLDVRTYLQDALVVQGVRGVDASDLFLEGSTLPPHVRRLLEETRPGFQRRGYRVDRSGDLTLEAAARRSNAAREQLDVPVGDQAPRPVRGEALEEDVEGLLEDVTDQPAEQRAEAERDARQTEQDLLERIALQQEEEEAARARGRAGAMDLGDEEPGQLAGEGGRDQDVDPAGDRQPEERTARRRGRRVRSTGEQAERRLELELEQQQEVRRSVARRLRDLAERRERARTALDAWAEAEAGPAAELLDRPRSETLRASMIRARRGPLAPVFRSERAALQPTLTEQAIGFAIEDRLAREPFLAPYELEVDYAGGTAVLSGLVDDLRVRQAAERIALDDPRVLDVVNQIELAGLPGDLLPEAVRARVSRKILDHPTLGSRDIVVLFAGDEVRLAGTVHTEREALLAERLVRQTPGIDRVVNELVIQD